MPYDWVHLAKLAKPKPVHPFYIPDRASVYWLDYLIDPTPRSMTNPEELRQYYENETKKFPSVVRLSKPKIHDDEKIVPTRPMTSQGVSTATLNYVDCNGFSDYPKFTHRHQLDRGTPRTTGWIC